MVKNCDTKIRDSVKIVENLEMTKARKVCVCLDQDIFEPKVTESSRIEGVDEVQIGGGFFGRALVVGVETAAETFRRALSAQTLSSMK